MAVLDNALPVRVLAMSPGNPEDPKAIPLRLDFAVDTLFTTNLETQRQQTKFQSLRSIYYNTLGCVNNITIYFPDSQQRMVLNPGKQGYREVLVDQTMRVEISGTSPDVALIHLLNVDVPTYEWPLTAGDVPGSIPLSSLEFATAQFNLIGRSSAGAGPWEEVTRAQLSLARIDAGNTFMVQQVIAPVSGAPAALALTGDAATAQITMTRNETVAGGPLITMRHARGTAAVPLINALSDVIGQMNFNGYDGAAFIQGANMTTRIIEPVPAVGAMGSDFRFSAAPVGTAAVVEILRLTGTAIQAFGANTVIDNNRGIRRRAFTFATLPAAAGVQDTMFVITDGAAAPAWRGAAAGGGALRTSVISDGAAWLNG